MKTLRVVVFMAAAMAGCAAPGSAEDFKWSIECPKIVEKGVEFQFTVTSANPAGESVAGTPFRYQILWPAGSSKPLPHKARTGEPQKLHARRVAGPASIVVTCESGEKQETNVLECAFEVKE